MRLQGGRPTRHVKSVPRPANDPRLTVAILTKDSEARLERLLAEVSWFADEIVVGVDADSTDRTTEIAARFADTVFHFRHAGRLAAARMQVLDYATGDWIFSVDDDESLEPGFVPVLREVLSNTLITHAWFPRKNVVNTAPYAFAFAPSWYPDWQLRLFRNDASLVWKPAAPHSGYHVLGPGRFEGRAAILHFEPVWLSPEARRLKHEARVLAGGDPLAEADHEAMQGAPRRSCAPPASPAPNPDRVLDRAAVHPPSGGTAEVAPPAWGCQVLSAILPESVAPGERTIAEVTVRNTGKMHWAPQGRVRSAEINLSYHLLAADRELLIWDGERAKTLGLVPPGAETVYFVEFSAPAEPGDYLLEWEMVVEFECWFAERTAGALLASRLRVRAKKAPRKRRPRSLQEG